jgi:hypothetical protein
MSSQQPCDDHGKITDQDRAVAKEAHDWLYPHCAFNPGGKIERGLIRAAFNARTGWTPTDPLLLEAREFAAQVYEARGWITVAAQIRQGELDNDYAVQAALLVVRSREGKS